MAIVLHQELAESSIENYDAVAERIRIDSHPPEGLIVHSASPMEGGGVRIVASGSPKRTSNGSRKNASCRP